MVFTFCGDENHSTISCETWTSRICREMSSVLFQYGNLNIDMKRYGVSFSLPYRFAFEREDETSHSSFMLGDHCRPPKKYRSDFFPRIPHDTLTSRFAKVDCWYVWYHSLLLFTIIWTVVHGWRHYLWYCKKRNYSYWYYGTIV